MIHLRLSRRVQGRVDDSDVLQETFLDVARRLKEYTADPKLPFYLWLRHMAGLKLAEVHRRHLGTQLRDADREVTLHRGGLPAADSVRPARSPRCWGCPKPSIGRGRKRKLPTSASRQCYRHGLDTWLRNERWPRRPRWPRLAILMAPNAETELTVKAILIASQRIEQVFRRMPKAAR
jgi:hypothetical protein